ncbi:MAG TPA: outer membrane beta-barrel protein [Hyphomicrobium sp.]|nr:outer membrane beta-barrel protein [Hyphomicrobium sp.]
MAIQTRARSALASAALCALTVTPVHAQALEPYEIPIWTGVYAGLHGGGNWMDFKVDPLGDNGLQAGAFGGHIGAMTQFGALVAGVEADLDYKSADSTFNLALDVPTGDTLTASARSSLSANGTIRGRLGVTLSPQLMVYATAGYAWATIDSSVTGTLNGEAFAYSNGTTLNGIAYGLGVEAFLTSNVLLRVEAIRIDYDDITLAGATATTPALKLESSSDVIRAGISWRFN